MRRKFWYLVFFGAIVMTWISGDTAYSQSSANYSLAQFVIDSGGGQQRSASYTLYHSIGQAVTGIVVSSDNYIHTAGFYARKRQRLDPLDVAFEKVLTYHGDPSHVNVGDLIEIGITVKNFLADPLLLFLQDSLDSYVDYVASSLRINGENAPDTCISDGLLDYQADPLGSGETLTVSYHVTLKDTAPPGASIENIAWLTAFRPLFNTIYYTERNLALKVNEVPEPSTFIFLATGLFGLLVLWKGSLKRGRKKRS